MRLRNPRMRNENNSMILFDIVEPKEEQQLREKSGDGAQDYLLLRKKDGSFKNKNTAVKATMQFPVAKIISRSFSNLV